MEETACAAEKRAIYYMQIKLFLLMCNIYRKLLLNAAVLIYILHLATVFCIITHK